MHAAALLRRPFIYVSCVTRHSHIHNLDPLQIQPLELFSLKYLSSSSNQEDAFIVSYLMNSCGLSRSAAESVSRKCRISDPENADRVISLLRSLDFSPQQISKIVRLSPNLLRLKPEETILPKLDFFSSKGLSRPDIAQLLSSNLSILRFSLERCIIPAFNLYREVLKCDRSTLHALRRSYWTLSMDPQRTVVPNMMILRDNGVPESKAALLLKYSPTTFYHSPDKFRDTVNFVREMPIDPKSGMFVYAVCTKLSSSKSNWESKLSIYRSWGWSEEEFLSAFGKCPLCMKISEDKINRVMDFVVNKMGWEASVIAKNPLLLILSLEKRIIPRATIFLFLSSKGLVQKQLSWSSMISLSERQFVQMISRRYQDLAPDIIALYKEKINEASRS